MRDHLQYANVSTGDEFVCSMYCYVCDLNRRLLALRTLASNLTIAAALCRAWELGAATLGYTRSLRLNTSVIYGDDWHPGCGRSTP